MGCRLTDNFVKTGYSTTNSKPSRRRCSAGPICSADAGAFFPGMVLGAVLIQSVENGLNILNVAPYLYPLITSAIIFLAVLLDSARNHLLATRSRRRIRGASHGETPFKANS
jgi:hypothetical protein